MSVSDSLRFTRVKKMLKLSENVEKSLQAHKLANDDPLVVFCKLAADVAEDAFIFKTQLDNMKFSQYASTTADTKFTSKASLLNKKQKKKKKERDPNAPKRPTPAAFLFANANKEKVKGAEEHKGKNGNEIKKILGQMWKTASEEEKKPFMEKYNAAYKIYKEALIKYKDEKKN